jgi:hypothetical protein
MIALFTLVLRLPLALLLLCLVDRSNQKDRGAGEVPRLSWAVPVVGSSSTTSILEGEKKINCLLN